MAKINLAIILKNPKNDDEFLLAKQTPSPKFGDTEYDSYVDSDLWDFSFTKLNVLEGDFVPLIAVAGIDWCLDKIDLRKFDVDLALNQVLEQVGCTVADGGEWRFWKHMKEAEFGPGLPIETVFFDGNLVTRNPTLQESCKWASVQSFLNWILEVKPSSDRLGPSVVVGLLNDSLQSRAWKIPGNLNYQDLVDYRTKELDLKGKIVVPGFIDSHVHLIWGGLQMVQVELRGINRKDEFVRKVKETVRNRKQGSWILGGGWNNDLWGGDLPMASWIDDITPNNPVWLSRMDGHMGLANSLALKMAGITHSSEDPDGGTIMRTASGEPTGLLIDSAMKLLLSCIPEVSVNERREALQRASSFALTRGVTTVVDFGRYIPGSSVEQSWEDFSDVYQWADSSGKRRIRVCLFFPSQTWSRLFDVVEKVGHSMSQWLYLGGVKAFADGSLGSSSALFHEPYVEEPHNKGLQVMDYEELFNLTLASDKHGLQVAIHAIGDRANDLILDMYDSVISKNGIRDRRFRIEHAQHLTPGTSDRFGKLGVVASVQPEHLLDEYESAIKKLGFDRAQKGSYLFRSLINGNAQLAFGSDWPVASINPLGGIRTAMKRMSPTWDGAWNLSETLSLDDALKAHTILAAWACFLDNDIGSISPGKLADFVVLSPDSWDDFARGGSASVEATYVGGVQVYP